MAPMSFTHLAQRAEVQHVVIAEEEDAANRKEIEEQQQHHCDVTEERHAARCVESFSCSLSRIKFYLGNL